MGISKSDLFGMIKRAIGYPLVKVELDNQTMSNSVDIARMEWVKWAAGTATQETYFTILLSGGQNFYQLPDGVTEVIKFVDECSAVGGGINTLFTLDNYMYNQGMFNPLIESGGGSGDATLVNYYIARGFIETVERFLPSKYNWKYHKYQNVLEIHPAPSTDSYLNLTTSAGDVITVCSPGFVMLHTMMIQGSSLDNWSYQKAAYTSISEAENGIDVTYDLESKIYEEPWVRDYATALCMRALGYARRKFQNNTSLGTDGIALDGADLINEANTLIEKLETKLRTEEPSIGYGILIG
jgi:hypothetical protein